MSNTNSSPVTGGGAHGPRKPGLTKEQRAYNKARRKSRRDHKRWAKENDPAEYNRIRDKEYYSNRLPWLVTLGVWSVAAMSIVGKYPLQTIGISALVVGGSARILGMPALRHPSMSRFVKGLMKPPAVIAAAIAVVIGLSLAKSTSKELPKIITSNYSPEQRAALLATTDTLVNNVPPSNPYPSTLIKVIADPTAGTCTITPTRAQYFAPQGMVDVISNLPVDIQFRRHNHLLSDQVKTVASPGDIEMTMPSSPGGDTQVSYFSKGDPTLQCIGINGKRIAPHPGDTVTLSTASPYAPPPPAH